MKAPPIFASPVRAIPLGSALLAAALLALPGESCGVESAPSSGPPGPAAPTASRLDLGQACPACNIVLISIDTLRADHLSCYGYSRDTSPRICAFFQDHIRFAHAISQSGWTAPAHASMFTSLYPSKHGVSYGPLIPALASRDTLFHRLRSHGYYVFSLNGGGYLRPTLPLSQMDFHRETALLRGNLVSAFEGALAGNHAAKPFFLFLHGYDVHTPYAPRRNHFLPPDPEVDARARRNEYCKYQDLDDGSRLLAPSSVPQDTTVRRYLASLYDSEIREVDTALGRFFQHLKETGRLAQTVVILTSDHGEEFWEHGSCEHVKTVYNELLHVPLMIRGPRTRPWVSQEPVAASLSIFPTILDILGLSRDTEHFDGRSLFGPPLPAILSESQFHYGRRHLRRYSVVKGGLKLVLDADTGRAELYDMASDWQEHHDLLTGAPGEKRHQPLRPLLDRYIASAPRPEQSQEELDPETLRQLRSLGYIE